MNGWYGLIELVLVLGWALWELRKTRNYKPPPAKPKDDGKV